MTQTTKSNTDIRTVRQARVLAMLVIILSAWLVYNNAFDGVLFMDDHYHIVNHPKQLPTVMEKLSDRLLLPGREFTDATFALSNRLHGTESTGYHAVNVGLHAVNACLIYWLILRLIQFFKIDSGDKPPRSSHLSNDRAALIGAMLFTVHPLFSACVNYAVQRYTLMVTAVYIVTVLVYLKARRTPSGIRWMWYAGTALSGWVAFHTKEIGITLPLVFGCLELLRVADKPLQRRTVATALVVLFGFGAVSLVELHGIGWFQSVGAALWSPWQQFQAESIAFVHYWKMLFLPLDPWMTIDHDFRISGLMVDTRALAALVFHITVAAGAWILVKNGRKLAAMGIGWFYIALLPYWVVPEADLLVNYKAYLPGVGFILMAADLAAGWRRKRRPSPVLIRAAALILICLLAGVTKNRNTIYSDTVRLWEDTVKKSPGKARVLNNRGFAYHRKGASDQAMADYTTAIELLPSYARAYENRGCLHFELGQYDRALSDFTKTIVLNTNTARSHTNLGSALLALSKPQQAIDSYTKALSIDSSYADAYYNRGVAHLAKRQWARAWLDFDNTLRAAPSHAAARKEHQALTDRFDAMGENGVNQAARREIASARLTTMYD